MNQNFEKQITFDRKINEGPDEGMKSFILGNIHNPKFMSFWRNDLKASSWVLEILENAYYIPFIEEPEEYEEPPLPCSV